MNKYKNLMALTMLAAMIGISVLLNEPEIIFPEITALTVGAWVAVKQPWKVHPVMLCSLISISAILGIVLVRADFIPMILKIAIGFIFCGVSLMVCDSTFVPMISACILPILMGTTSVIYPLSVAVMSIIIVLVQIPIQSNQAYKRSATINYGEQLLLWVKRFIIVLAISALPVYFKEYFFIAPPLIVAFVEITNVDSPARKRPLSLLFLIALSSISGAYLRLIITEHFGLSLVISAVLATAIVLLAMKKLQLYFPPAGAISTLPMIISSQKLIIYPVEVIIGFSIMIILAITLFRQFCK